MNLSTFLVALLVLGIFVLIAAGEVRRHKRGGGCGCGCQGCPGAGLCHGGGKEQPKR